MISLPLILFLSSLLLYAGNSGKVVGIISDEISNELVNSKDLIEQLIGKEVVSIAPPFGVLSHR